MGLQGNRVSINSHYIMLQKYGPFAFLLNCKVSSLVIGMSSTIEYTIWGREYACRVRSKLLTKYGRGMCQETLLKTFMP